MRLYGRLLLAAIGIFFLATPFAASAFVPFGGTITLIRPCIGGGLVLATIAQPPPLPTIEVTAAVSPFLYFTMSHVGQHVLGLMTSPTACWTGPRTLFVVPFSSFYGTSI